VLVAVPDDELVIREVEVDGQHAIAVRRRQPPGGEVERDVPPTVETTERQKVGSRTEGTRCCRLDILE
jgi:hypothetical protein